MCTAHECVICFVSTPSPTPTPPKHTKEVHSLTHSLTFGASNSFLDDRIQLVQCLVQDIVPTFRALCDVTKGTSISVSPALMVAWVSWINCQLSLVSCCEGIFYCCILHVIILLLYYSAAVLFFLHVHACPLLIFRRCLVLAAVSTLCLTSRQSDRNTTKSPTQTDVVHWAPSTLRTFSLFYLVDTAE